MEWLLLLALALGAGAAIGAPALRRSVSLPASDPAAELQAERVRLLAELRELDDDLQAGRIAAADRALGRRALGPRLRAVTEALRGGAEEPRP
jgi:hypothetical protein